MGYSDIVTIDKMLGKTFVSVEKVGDDELYFHLEDGSYFFMHHNQDCCEYVYINDIVGDLSDLVGSPIVRAEESSNNVTSETEYESQTWTFYKFATIKGYVDIRWHGSSNGYYSEEVDIEYLKPVAA